MSGKTKRSATSARRRPRDDAWRPIEYRLAPIAAAAERWGTDTIIMLAISALGVEACAANPPRVAKLLEYHLLYVTRALSALKDLARPHPTLPPLQHDLPL